MSQSLTGNAAAPVTSDPGAKVGIRRADVVLVPSTGSAVLVEIGTAGRSVGATRGTAGHPPTGIAA